MKPPFISPAVWNAAETLFEGNHDAARDWLSRPVKGLGHRIPTDVAQTPAGEREVLRLNGDLDNGIPH